MKRLALLSAIAATLFLAVVAAAAPPPVDADAYVVQNSGTGEILAAQDEHEHLPMASITKLMTAIVALEHASLDDVATISKRTAAVGESTINLVPGERVTLRDLIRAALIQSANDAANAIAAFVGRGSVARFVELMNARARQLGMSDTHFANPDGLDAPGHYSSAADVTKLGRVAMNKPFIRETVRLVQAEAAGRRLHKRRHAVPHNDLTIEIDVYAGDLEGLIVAETEFPSEEEARAFDPPAWLGKEVTGDRRYLNETLATEGRPD